MKKIMSLLVAVIISISAFSSEKSTSNSGSAKAMNVSAVKTIKGKITDLNSKDGLSGVEVSVYGSNTKTYTDFNGNFEIKNVSIGAQALMINYISYHQKIQDVNIKNDNEVELNVSLTPKD